MNVSLLRACCWFNVIYANIGDKHCGCTSKPSANAILQLAIGDYVFLLTYPVKALLRVPRGHRRQIIRGNTNRFRIQYIYIFERASRNIRVKEMGCEYHLYCFHSLYIPYGTIHLKTKLVQNQSGQYIFLIVVGNDVSDVITWLKVVKYSAMKIFKYLASKTQYIDDLRETDISKCCETKYFVWNDHVVSLNSSL